MNAIFIAIGVFIILALLFGALLGFAAIKFKVADDPIAEQINEILPQTQCGQCGYPGCRPYAQAIANGESIDKCTPGGKVAIEKIAHLLGVEIPHSNANETNAAPIKSVAFIDEANCIGCTKCMQVCPVDAIVGSTRTLHTVIKSECTGCQLCVAPCPTECIKMIPIKATTATWAWQFDLATQRIPIQDITQQHTTATLPANATEPTNTIEPTMAIQQPKEQQ